MKKTFFYNFIIFIFLFLCIELFFGYWLEKNNFGFFIRNERLIEKNFEVILNEKKYLVTYKRNYYGFRGEEVDPSKIKVIFEGGSTGNQKFLPENYTIVGQLNSFLSNDKINTKIYNASTDGKTIKGYINDFKSWFEKISDLKATYYIFYLGINDSNIFKPIWGYNSKFDIGTRSGIFEKTSDYIRNNSITYELIIKIYNKYFSKYFIQNNPNHVYQDLYTNYNYIDYNKAKIIYNELELSKDEKYLLKYYKSQLGKLNSIINQYKIIPIFITQIQYNGIGTKSLFLINEETKKFAKSNNYYLIKLDEIIKNIEKNDFYDPFHNQISASKKIADAIYPEIKKIFNMKF